METIHSFRKRLATIHNPSRRFAEIVGFIASSDIDPAEISDLASEAEQIAVKQRMIDELGKVPLYLGIAYRRTGAMDNAGISLRRAFDLLREGHLGEEMGMAAFHLGEIYRSAHQYEDASRWYEQALDAWQGDDLLARRMRAVRALGETCREIGRWEKALFYLIEVLSFHEKRNEPAEVAAILIMIGTVYARTGDSVHALGTLERALQIYRDAGDKYGEVNVLSNLAEIHRQRGELGVALEQSLTALAIYQMLGDRLKLVSMLMTIGAIYEADGHFESALGQYLRAHDTLEGSEDARLHASVLHAIGRMYRQTGDIPGAQLLLENACAIARQHDDRHLQGEIHGSLSLTLERLGDLSNALAHHRRYMQIKDELAGEEKQKEIASLQVRYEIEKAEREREYYRREAKRLEDETTQRAAQLATMAMNLVQMNTMIDHLRERIEELVNGAGSPNRGVAEDIRAMLQNGIRTDKAWEMLEQQLNMAHPEFVQRLSERHPTLSLAELKVCSLLKINLASKDIANLLTLSARTVETHRFNIGRKLDLPKGVRLVNYLASI
jgi:tetratricopeptide (TPR) repeat protein/DNA-binding CsgD family transcriptional regulator